MGNINYNASAEDLRELFGTVGTVVETLIITDRETGQSKGFGFVTMADPAEANAAINKFHGYEFQRRRLVVEEAKAQTKR